MRLTVLTAATAVPAVSAQVPAQSLAQLYHTAWTVRDGAPADIAALAQTADGFLWLGSGTGLFRFDGIRFELFEPPPRQFMPSTNVSALCATPDTGLWVGYRFGGVSLLRRGTIQSYGEPDGLPRGSVVSIVSDSATATWVGTTVGLARIERGRLHSVGPDEGLPEGGVTGMLLDHRRRLWVAARAGLFLRRPGGTHFERVGPPLTLPEGEVYSWMQDGPDGAIWGSSEKGLQLLLPASGGHDNRVPPRLRASGPILIDRSGALWVAVSTPGIERVWLYPPAGAGRGPGRERMIAGLSSDDVRTWLEDREGDVWTGTAEGLDRFRRAKLNRVELPGVSGRIALAAADSGAVWVGSIGHPLLYIGGRLREFPEVPGYVEVAYRDPAGVAWIGGRQGLWRFNGDKFVRVGLPDVTDAPIQAATIDAQGDLWISIVRNGIWRRTGDRWMPFGGYPALPREPAIVLTTDQSGRTWFGYTGSRVALLEGGTVRLYTGEHGLSVGNVLAIHIKGTHVWVGGELGLATLVAGRFRPVTGNHGAGFRGTSGIVETPDGEVWLNGAGGISRIPATEVVRVLRDSTYQVQSERLDFHDGLAGSAVQIRPQPTVIAGTDGRLWFATSVSIAWLDPRAIPRNPLPPPIVIRRLTAGNTSYPVAPNLGLPVHTTALRIEYSALSLSMPERVHFRYQLVGSDTTWQDAGGRREVFYTNLSPGSYRFRVIAANEDGVWNRTGASLGFTIPPSFTQTRWFLGVWVVALAGLAWLAYLLRMRQVAGGLRVRYEAAMAERARIAQELHDTLLQGFTGITLQLRAIQRILAQRPQESAEALKSVLASADTALRDARHMIWDMRAVELEGHDLPTALEMAVRQAMAGSSAQLGFTVDGDRRRLPLATEATALRVGREAVINAVKHAAPRVVEVSLTYAPQSLALRVEDDGSGIPSNALEAAAAGEHLGMAGMRDRAHRVGGNLEITSTPGQGTVVSMSLPIRDKGERFPPAGTR